MSALKNFGRATIRGSKRCTQLLLEKKFRGRAKTLSNHLQGFSIVELLITISIIAIVGSVVYQLYMIPFITQAKAMNFQEAELDSTMYALRSSKNGELLEPVPANCTVSLESEEDEIHSIECTVGSGEVKAKAKSNIFLRKINLFAGDFADSNKDGYEDTTGLQTHYDECYAGWKGAEGTKGGKSAGGFKSSACTLGGEYLIPMFSEIPGY